MKDESKLSRGEQIKQILREEVRSMPVDAPISPELDLAQRFGVSRTTVRLAITDLVSEGLLYRRQGSGTYKNGVAINNISYQVEGFSDQLMRCGFTPELMDITVSCVPVPPQFAGKLGISAGDEVWKYTRIWASNQTPIAYGEAYIRKDIVPVFRAEDIHLSLLEALDKKYGVKITSAESFSSAVSPRKIHQQKLGISKTAPLLKMDYYGYTKDQIPVFVDVAHTIGEKYVLHIRQTL